MAGGQWEYEVALSFAGEQREYVREVATLLRSHGVSVFYDEFAEAEIWGSDLGTTLGEIYGRRSKFIVVFVSNEYVTKSWPDHERQHAISGRITRRDVSVLPVKFGEVALPGLPETVAYLDARRLTPAEIVDRILRKLGKA
jgi:hypothetical protein